MDCRRWRLPTTPSMAAAKPRTRGWATTGYHSDVLERHAIEQSVGRSLGGDGRIDDVNADGGCCRRM
jgi:hypothetical protein